MTKLYTVSDIKEPDMEGCILYEDNHLIAVDKPAGMLVHGDRTGDPSLAEEIKQYIKLEEEKPGAVYLGVIHRLDRPVSGAILFARTSKALARMNRIFKKRKITKCYVALTEQAPPRIADRIVHYLRKDRKKNKVFFSDTEREGYDRAEGSYQLVGEMNDRYIIAFFPVTGRPHQIRVQMSAVGCPICGDLKYGFPRPLPDASIALHSLRMSFTHPVQQTDLTIESPWPTTQDWARVREFNLRNIPLYPFA